MRNDAGITPMMVCGSSLRRSVDPSALSRGEVSPPEAIAQQDNVGRPGLVLVGPKRSAERRRSADGLEKRG